MFLGLLEPDPLVRGTDPDPNPSIIKQNRKKNLVISFYLRENYVNVPSKSNKQKNLGKKIVFPFLWRLEVKD
jgi:hypothetical protein